MQQTQQSRQNTIVYDDSLNDQSLYQEKHFVIPHMSKKMNTIQKYIKKHSMSPIPQKNVTQPLKSQLSHYGTNLIYGGKITPQLGYQEIEEAKSYVKYSPLKDYATNQRLDLLENIGFQYQRLKNGLSNREPYLSKHSMPLITKRTGLSKQKSSKKPKLGPEEIQEELKKSFVKEKGKQYYADLYMLKRERDKIVEAVRKGQSPQKKHDDDLNKEEAFLIQKKTKELKEKKAKMIKSKGMNWNVYYEALALSKDQKKKFKGHKFKFVEDFGIQ